jgi:phage terminase large subunit-like protein
MFPPQKGLSGWRFITEGWIPEDNMKERVKRDGVPYNKWLGKGYLHATAGNVVDYGFIEARILQVCKQYKLVALGTDPWNSRMLTQRLMAEGVEVIEITQNMASLSPAMKEFERLSRTGDLTHEENPAARWCFGNMAIAVDGNENIKPMKNKAADRIDLTVAAIIAMAMLIKFGELTISVYEERGVRAL